MKKIAPAEPPDRTPDRVANTLRQGAPLPRETLEAFLDGDAAAFAEVVRAYGPIVRRVASRFWSSVFECEDALQEVWLHVLRHRHQIDRDRLDSLPGWLSVVAQRCCIAMRRRSRGEPVVHDEGTAATIASEEETDRAIVEGDLRREVDAFTARLRPQWRRFFELHFVEGLEYADIARQLSISTTRCKYMKRVLTARAKRSRPLRGILERPIGGSDAP